MIGTQALMFFMRRTALLLILFAILLLPATLLGLHWAVPFAVSLTGFVLSLVPTYYAAMRLRESRRHVAQAEAAFREAAADVLDAHQPNSDDLIPRCRECGEDWPCSAYSHVVATQRVMEHVEEVVSREHRFWTLWRPRK